MSLFKKRNIASTSAFRKKGLEASTASRADSESESDSESETDASEDSGKALKRLKKSRKTTGSNAATSAPTPGAHTNTDIGLVAHKPGTPHASNNHATKENIFQKIEKEEEQRRHAEKLEFLKHTESLGAADADARAATYKGESDYKTYGVPTKSGLSAASKAKFGPMKAATNVRSTTVIDYQPDVCKDYKLTGYCGYGDNCKFLHSREDYKAGWQLDKDWEIGKGKNSETKELEGSKELEDSKEKKKNGLALDVENIPFKCVICKEDYKSPVKTTCGHYFCEECFLKQYRARPVCFICGKKTGGIVKPAKELQELLKHKERQGQLQETEAP